MTTYTIKKGDSLWAIGKKYGVTVADLASANGIKVAATIYPGQVLRIPTKNEDTNKDYEAIGKKVAEVLADVEKLTSYKELMKLL